MSSVLTPVPDPSGITIRTRRGVVGQIIDDLILELYPPTAQQALHQDLLVPTIRINGDQARHGIMLAANSVDTFVAAQNPLVAGPAAMRQVELIRGTREHDRQLSIREVVHAGDREARGVHLQD
jgi:hypothetical protein